MEQHKRNNKKEEKEINFQWFLITFLVHWKWFIFSLIVFLALGYLYLRYSTPIYKVETSIILRDNKKGGLDNSELPFLEGMGFIDANTNVENEIEVLRSRNLIENVVIEQGLFVRHIVKGRFKDTEIYNEGNRKYYSSLPIKVFTDMNILSALESTILLEISVDKNSVYHINGLYGNTEFSGEYSSLPAILQTPIGELMILEGNVSLDQDIPIEVQIIPPLYIAQYYMSQLTLELTGKNTSIVKVSLNETHRRRGEDFLNKLIDLYNRDTMEDKNKGARKAYSFIEERLAELNKELTTSERSIESYKRENRISDIEAEAQMRFAETNAYEKQLIQAGTEIELLSFLEKEIEKGDKSLLPSSLGLIDATLTANIERYNQSVLEKERLLAYTSEESPRIKRLDEEISSFKENIRTNIQAIRVSILSKKNELDNLSQIAEHNFGDVPRREREYNEMMRQQTIKSNLYVSLLQRKEQVSLSLAVIAPSAKVLESPLASGGPISPRKMLTYLICFILGFIFPYIIMGIRELINYKLSDEGEVRRYSDVPVIVSLPYTRSKATLLVTPTATSPIVERFRLLRTNLQFILDDPSKKTILVTSTISGEGKTFVSINLAQTFALKYKTILVGLDIRRPKINSYLDLPKEEGLISYLTGKEKDINKLIFKNVKKTNLDVLISGIVPPNPNELLIEKTLDNLFLALREQYDYIIIDSSPVGSVSDAFLLNRISDVSLFVIRKDFSPKSAITFINSIYEENRLNNINLVLNAFNEGKAGKYGYSYGYGYGYGYGYSSEK